VAAFVASTFLDWDDRISAALVLQGCNLRCPFCHSSKFVPPGPPQAEVPWDDIRRHIVESGGFLQGVVVSGGEPTVHGSLAALLERVRALRRPVKLDTNGTNPRLVREMVEAGLVRHVAMDVKAPLAPEKYARAAGVEAARGEWLVGAVRESLGYLRERHVSYELRTTACPAVFPYDATGEEGLLGLAKELAWAEKWFLQSFRPVYCLDPQYEKLAATPPGWLKAVAGKCREVCPGCRVRGDF